MTAAPIDCEDSHGAQIHCITLQNRSRQSVPSLAFYNLRHRTWTLRRAYRLDARLGAYGGMAVVVMVGEQLCCQIRRAN